MKKISLILGAVFVLSISGCSTLAPMTITAIATQMSTVTSTQLNTVTATQLNTVTATQTNLVTTTAIATTTTTTTQIATTTAVPVTLNISAAATLTNALNEVNALYTQSKPWVTITPNYASVGTIQAQIENGLSCDVFFSADSQHMDNLQNENLLLAGTRINLLNNTTVLIVPKGNPLGITGFNDLTLSKVKIIGIGDPKSTVLGALAQQTFTELGILSAIQSKFVLASVVTQLMQYVDSGNADAAIVFSTDALADSNVMVVAAGPADVNATISYPAAVLKASKNVTAAQDYLNFLSSVQAKAVFVKYGFVIASK